MDLLLLLQRLLKTYAAHLYGCSGAVWNRPAAFKHHSRDVNRMHEPAPIKDGAGQDATRMSTHITDICILAHPGNTRCAIDQNMPRPFFFLS